MITRYTVYCQLVAKRESLYTEYVFKNLDEPEDSWDRYITVTRRPNWQCPVEMKIGVKGYLEFEPITAGDLYYNSSTKNVEAYKYPAYYFTNFIEKIET